MKTPKTAVLALASGAALLAGGASPGYAVAAPAAPAPATTASTASADAALATMLSESREEERMARDLYAALAAAHGGARPMSVIAKSEDMHYRAVGALLQRYGVSDPSAGRAAGSYAVPELQALSERWLSQGKASLAAAYAVGVELEQRDIADLRTAIAAVSPADVKSVLTRLDGASEHHLAAFRAAASGATAAPGAGWGGMGTAAGDRGTRGFGGGPGGAGMGRMSGATPGDCPMLGTATTGSAT